MRVAVTGAGGLLGTTLVPLWREAGAEVVAWSRAELDVTDREAARRLIAAAKPEVVVHLAAWTDVDGAEAAPAAAARVNADGTAHVAAACREAGALLVHLSTDYVFAASQQRTPLGPQADPVPAGAYATSKAAAEIAVRADAAAWLILRTGWVYGTGGRNFVDTMRRKAEGRESASVVDDQVGAPTPTRLVAEVALGLVQAGCRGIWHAAAGGSTSWCGVARVVYESSGADQSLVRPCTTAQAARAAPRPAYSVLDCSATEAALGARMPRWDEAVRHYLSGRGMAGLRPAGAAA